MSSPPIKGANDFVKQYVNQPSQSLSPEEEAVGESFYVESDSGPLEGSSPYSSSQASSSTSGFLRNEKLWADCLHFINKARKLSPLTTDNFVENLPVESICQLHQKMYTFWVNLYNPDKSSERSSEAALPTEEPKKTNVSYLQSTTTAHNSSVIDIICQELEKLRNSVQATGPSDIKMVIHHSKNDPASPECVQAAILVDLTPEDMADPLDLLLRLIDFSDSELNKIEEAKKDKAESSHLLRPSTLPAITSVPSEQVTSEKLEPELYEIDLLRRFRCSLEIEAQKLADKIRARVDEPKPETDSSSRAVEEMMEPKDSSIESCSSKQYQPLNEDSKASDLSMGWTEVDFAKDTSLGSTFFEEKATDKNGVALARGSMRSTGPSKSRNPRVPADADDTLRDVPSIPCDSPSSEGEPLTLDSPCTEEETEL